MKTKLLFVALVIFGSMITGCKQPEPEIEVVKIDLLNDEFADAKQEVKMTLDSISQSVQDGDLDRLISFHAYSPKFTEFKDGEPRNDGAANEEYERNVFGAVTDIVKFDMNDVKIAVYGEVANVTLHSDFHLQFGEDLAEVNEQMSLLFLNTSEGWRIVHEHHSALKKEETM